MPLEPFDGSLDSLIESSRLFEEVSGALHLRESRAFSDRDRLANHGQQGIMRTGDDKSRNVDVCELMRLGRRRSKHQSGRMDQSPPRRLEGDDATQAGAGDADSFGIDFGPRARPVEDRLQVLDESLMAAARVVIRLAVTADVEE